MKNVYPFATGSAYTASFSLTSSFAENAEKIQFAETASNAGIVLNPTSGSDAAVDICIITYQDYLRILSGSHFEVC